MAGNTVCMSCDESYLPAAATAALTVSVITTTGARDSEIRIKVVLYNKEKYS